MSSNYDEFLKQQESILNKAKSETGSSKPKDKPKTPSAAPLEKKKVNRSNH
jgi:hypothetical protein